MEAVDVFKRDGREHHDLYHGNYDAKQIVFLRDLYDLLEKVIDRCRDAGNIILQVVLKYS